MKTATKYIADDGTEFETAEACKAYEVATDEKMVGDADFDAIGAALAGKNADLSDALENLGNRCAKARRERGETRRKPAVAAVPADGPKTQGEAPKADAAVKKGGK